MIPSQLWTKERENILRQCIEDKMTAKQSGEVLHVSRNACIGKAGRMGLKFVSNQGKRPPRIRRERQWKPPVQVKQKFPYREAPLTAPELTVEHLNLSLWDIKDNSCRWITNDDLKAALYCGLPVAEDGGSWCESCRMKVFQPTRIQ